MVWLNVIADHNYFHGPGKLRRGSYAACSGNFNELWTVALCKSVLSNSKSARANFEILQLLSVTTLVFSFIKVNTRNCLSVKKLHQNERIDCRPCN